MPRSNVQKWIVKDPGPDGVDRWYVRKPGQKKIRLPGGPDHKGFNAAYEAALKGDIVFRPEKKPEVRSIPRAARRPYVYFLAVEDTVKIGYSANPMSRISGLTTGIAGPYDAMLIVHGTRDDERALHRKFQQFRIAGEWFRMNETIKRTMAQAAVYGIEGVEK